jgi:predicted ArsR family transcriptional regulator
MNIAPAARGTDRHTSREAARGAAGTAVRHRALIWHALRVQGPLGRFALAEVTGLDPIAVARRMSELVRQQLVEVVEDYYETTPSGRRGSVWRVACRP